MLETHRLKFNPVGLLFIALLLAAPPAPAQDSTLTYQGQLRDNGTNVTGNVDLRFQLYDALIDGNPIGSPIQRLGVPVEDGLFRVELDFGAAAFDGNDRFLEIEVNGAPLTPRQRVTATPYALLAGGLVGGVPETGWGLSGNAGTGPGNFLGTTDATALELRTANVRSLRIEPSAELLDGVPITTNTIAGSRANQVLLGVRGATISGGGVPGGNSDPVLSGENPNRVTDHYGTVGGGYANLAGDDSGSIGDSAFATVSGGVSNTASGGFSTIAGGDGNMASGLLSAVVGGAFNQASGLASTVAGGEFNTTTESAARATIGGGASNTASGLVSAVGGGFFNKALGIGSIVSGGQTNTASGSNSTVGGGIDNTAAGAFSFVVGRRAKNNDANHDGVFLFADSQNADTFSDHANQFKVRARGGAEFRVDDFGLRAVSNAPGVNAAALQADSDHANGIAIFGRNESTDSTLVLNNAGTGDLIRAFKVGTRLFTLENDGDLIISGDYLQSSDRASKEEIRPVAIEDILRRLQQLPLYSWRYIEDDDGARHIGPMAQDFYAAFEYGDSPEHIAMIDAQGVALAAIQALAERNAELESRNEELKERLDAVEQRQQQELTDLRAELAMLRELVAPRLAQTADR